MNFAFRVLVFLTTLTLPLFIFSKIVFSQNTFTKIILTPIVNENLQTFYQNPPLGDVVLGGVPFNIPNVMEPEKNMVFSSRTQVDARQITANIPNPAKVHLLLNSYDTWETNLGRQLGSVKIEFQDGVIHEVPLIIGTNIREWRPANDLFPTVNTVTDPASQEVFRGRSIGRIGPAVIDVLTINLPDSLKTKTVTKVTVTDTETAAAPPPAPATNPGIFWMGLTVETSQGIDPIIIIPGIGASLNFTVLTDREAFSTEGWKWTPTASSTWEDVIFYLERAGLTENKDYFIAFYDWRKTNDWTDTGQGLFFPALYLQATIDKALSANPGATEVDVIAHSMGGIVTSSYIRSPFYRGDIDQFVTLGTPFSGSTLSYFPWEGGKIPPTWDPVSKFLAKSSFKLLGTIHSIDNNFEVIHQFIKSIKNLLPVGHNYLVRQDGSTIDWQTMTEINNFLKDTLKPETTNQILESKGVELLSIAGVGRNTIDVLEVEPYQNSFGQLWEDGKPTDKNFTVNGDRTVITSSAIPDSAFNLKIEGGHGDLPNLAVQQIFAFLGIEFEKVKEPTIIERILSVFGGSPITIEITDSEGNLVGEYAVDEETGFNIIGITNPTLGTYQIKVNGIGKGTYHLTVNLDDENSTLTTEISGFAATGSETTYIINLANQQDEELTFTRSDTIDSLIENVQTAYDLRQIKNHGVKIAFEQTLKAAKRVQDLGQTKAAKQILKAFIREVKALREKLVDGQAADIFVEIAQYLIEN